MEISEDIKKCIQLGNQSKLIGECRVAIKYYLQILEFASQTSDRYAESLAISLLGDVLTFIGKPELAIEYHHYQLSVSENLNDKEGQANALFNLGNAYFVLQDFDTSKEYLSQSIKIVYEIQDEVLKARVANRLGIIFIQLKEFGKANELCSESLKISLENHFLQEQAEALVSLSILERNIKLSQFSGGFAFSEFENAAQKLYEGLGISKQICNPYLETKILIELAKTFAVSGELDLAKSKCEQALETTRKYNLPIVLECQELFADLINQIKEKEHDFNIKNQSWYKPTMPECDEVGNEKFKKLRDIVDVVIMTATDIEIISIVNLLDPDPESSKILKIFLKSGAYYYGRIGSYNIVVTKCRMGALREGSSTLATYDALNDWKPKAVIMVGIAFGRSNSEQKIGDVLVASEIIFYEQTRIGKDGIIDRGIIPPSSEVLFNRFDDAYGWQFNRQDNSSCKIIRGAVLSGEKLIDNPDFKANLFERFPHAIGGEMEGTGLCAAANRLRVPWIIIKSICDWGDGKKQKKHQPFAAAASADLVRYVLSQPYVLDSI